MMPPKAIGTLLLCLLFVGNSQAAVSLAGTRLIFDGRFREASIEASNTGDQEVLLQAWLSDADEHAASDPDDLPFAVTPHLVRLPARGKQSLRVLYEGLGMPVERESLLHLYVMDIPRRSDAQQQLTIAVRQRLNVFYRPAGLSGDPAEAAQALTWHLGTGPGGELRLQVRNPTPFHVSLLALQFDGQHVRDDWLIKPGETKAMPLHEVVGSGRLSFRALTDYGGQRAYCADLNADKPAAAQLTTGTSKSLIGKC